MAIIYIPVEVPDSELVKYLGGDYPIGTKVTVGGIEFTKHSEFPFPTQPGQQYTRTESEFGYQTQPADPWASPATGAPSPAAPYQPAPTPAAGAAQPTPQGNPRCAHGEMRFVPAGVSKSTGRAYGAFYGCPAQRGEVQCKSIKVGQ